MVGPARRIGSYVHAAIGLDANRVDVTTGKPIPVAISVRERPRRVVEVLDVAVDLVGGVIGAHPTQRIIVTDVGKGKSEPRVSGELPAGPFVAVNVSFVD